MKIIINHSCTASLTFSSGRPTEFPQTAGSGDHFPFFRCRQQFQLQFLILAGGKNLFDPFRKYRSLNDDHLTVYANGVYLSRIIYCPLRTFANTLQDGMSANQYVITHNPCLSESRGLQSHCSTSECIALDSSVVLKTDSLRMTAGETQKDQAICRTMSL